MSKKLEDYVKVFDNILPDNMCRMLCEKFDESKEKERIYRRNDTFNFQELNVRDLAQNNVKWKETARSMTGYMQKALSLYREETGNWVPDTKRFESPRLKRYDPDVGVFDWHLDSSDAKSQHRMLVMFWYLNDVEEGGETIFDFGDKEPFAVKPKKGSVCCFPPNYLFPHRGNPPKGVFKYVVSSYACYQ